ncbi:alginate lyase family protein [soil metagenome]
MKKLIIICSLFLFSSTQAQVCIWNLKSLDKAKLSNPELVEAVVRDAEKKLSQKIKTVVDKAVTAQSGDKHDYMSMGRYWWPDPAKADGLPYIRKDGISNPEIEKLDRYPLGDFAKSVESLSLAYYVTSDEKFAQKAVENLRTWFTDSKTMMNPNMNYGQTIPGIRNGLGRGEGILDSYSFVEMLDGVELLKKSKTFTTTDQQAIKEWFTAYVNWLQTSPVAKEEGDAPNNHGTAYDVQLTRYALFIGNQDLAKKVLNKFAQKRLFSQIEPDGSQPLELARTTALGYSTFNLTHFLDMCQIGKLLGIDLLSAKSKDGRSIFKAIDFLVQYINKPASQFPYQQIKEWDGVQQKLAWQLYRVDQMLANAAYQKYYTTSLDLGKKNAESILY